MLNQTFNPKPKQPTGPRQSGQYISNPRALAAIAIKNAQAATATLNPNSLAQTIAQKKKKKGPY